MCGMTTRLSLSCCVPSALIHLQSLTDFSLVDDNDMIRWEWLQTPLPALTSLPLRKCTLSGASIASIDGVVHWSALLNVLGSVESLTTSSCQLMGNLVEVLSEADIRMASLSISPHNSMNNDSQPFRYVPAVLQVQQLLHRHPTLRFSLQLPSLGDIRGSRTSLDPADVDRLQQLQAEWAAMHNALPSRVKIT
jgi:hypothetical protein